MDITKISAICLLSLIAILLVKSVNKDYASFISMGTGIGILIFSLGILFPVFEYIKSIAQSHGLSGVYGILLKSAGVCMLSSLASELCRDMGEGGLSEKIEFAGKCTLITFSLPLIKKVFEYAASFID